MSLTNSVWNEGLNPPRFPQLSEKIETDIVVVGAGITGLTSAYLLLKAGKKVVVLEKETAGAGETSNTTAFLNYVTDAELSELVEDIGKKKAVTIWNALRGAIDLIEKITTEEHIECEFKRIPLNYFAAKQEDNIFLHNEYKLMRNLGFPVTLQRRMFSSELCIVIADNAKFHPLKYLYGLAALVSAMGGRIFDHSEVLSYEHGISPKAVTGKGEVKAKHVIIATHNPGNWAFDIHTRILPYQTYVIGGTLTKGVVPEGLYIDTEDPYHYFRVDAGETLDRFLLGGEDHPTGKDERNTDHYQNLEKYLGKLVKEKDYRTTNRWNGQVIDTVDGLPYIGPSVVTPSETLAATGFAGDGMTFGTLSAIINTDIILGHTNIARELFSTKRMKGAKEFLQQNTNFIKEFVEGRRKSERAIRPEDIPNDTGVVIDENSSKVAVYKSDKCEITKMSAVCTHLGCIVRWNDPGKSWDCPCHGSRFNKDGSVMRGPAKKPLKRK